MEFGLNKRLFVLVIFMGLFVNAYSRQFESERDTVNKIQNKIYLQAFDLMFLNVNIAYEFRLINTNKRTVGICIPITYGINSWGTVWSNGGVRKVITIGLGSKIFSKKRQDLFLFPLLEFGEVAYRGKDFHFKGDYGIEAAKIGIVSFSLGKQIVSRNRKYFTELYGGVGYRYQNIENNNILNNYPIIKAGLNIGFNF